MCRTTRIVVLIAFLLASLLPMIASAQTEDPRIGTLSTFLEKRVETIDSWQEDAKWILILVLAVIALGGITSALQIPKTEKPVLRSVTAVAGILIVCLGSVKEQIFKSDRHALDKAAHQAEKLVEDAQMLLDEMKRQEDPAIRKELIEFYKETLAKIDGIEEDLASARIALGGPDGAPAGSFFAAPAFAQAPESGPEWVREPPENDLYLYFVGSAHSESLGKAKELSHQRAMEDAVAHFALEVRSASKKSLEIETRALSEKLVESATVEDTYFALDPETKTFRFDTLLRISRKAITRTVEFYALEQEQAVPEELVENLREVKGSSADYRVRRALADDLLLAEAQEVLEPEHHERFLEVRSRLGDEDPEAAREMLRAFVEGHQGFYLGWRELARAEAELGDVDAAVSAFERAVALEAELAERDPSVHAEFGRLLLGLGELEAANERFSTALAIEPEHAEARLGTLEVEQALAEANPPDSVP